MVNVTKLMSERKVLGVHGFMLIEWPFQKAPGGQRDAAGEHASKGVSMDGWMLVAVDPSEGHGAGHPVRKSQQVPKH